MNIPNNGKKQAANFKKYSKQYTCEISTKDYIRAFLIWHMQNIPWEQTQYPISHTMNV